MNYRHVFHAGNFADVLKHCVLARLLTYMTGKDKPLRYIDTHAGIGRYDLSGDAAQRTGEARDGLERLKAALAGNAALAGLMEPYLSALKAENAAHPGLYPGSPAIAARILREQDRLILCELHPEDHAVLSANFARDRRVKTFASDGFSSLKAHLPPVERRGLVLIDPAFEERNDLERSRKALADGLRRFAGGVYVLWHRIKDRAETDAFYAGLAALVPGECLALELHVDTIRADGPLSACGLVIVNPPWGTRVECEALLPALATALARGPGAHGVVRDLSRQDA